MKPKERLLKICDVLFGYELFRTVALVMVMLRSCALLNPIIGPFVKLTVVWAVLILAKDLFTEQLLFKNRFRLVLYLFMISYGVTTLLNRSEHFARNIAILGYLAVSMLVLYAYNPKKPAGRVKTELLRFSHVFLFVAFFGQFLSLLGFFLNINFSYQMDGYPYYFGIVEGRLWGFFSNPNSGSLYALLCLMLTVLCKLIQKSAAPKFLRVFYWVNLVVQALVFFLCNSRANLLVACFFIALYILMSRLPDLIESWPDKKARLEKLRGTAVLCIMLPLALLGADAYAGKILPSFVIQNSAISDQLTEGLDSYVGGVSSIASVADSEDLERSDYGSKLGGRYFLWQAGTEIVKHSPLFGVGNENVVDHAYRYAARYFTNYGANVYLPGIEGAGMHNLLFQLAAASGLVGLGIFVVFLFMLLIRMARYYIWMVKNNRINQVAVACGCILVSILLRTMLDSGIVYGLLEQGVVFWSLAGVFVYFSDVEYKGKKPLGARLLNKADRAELFRFRPAFRLKPQAKKSQRGA